MASLGLRVARIAGLASPLVIGCFHDPLPELGTAGPGTSSTGVTTGGDPSTGATTTGIATSGTTAAPSTTGAMTTGPDTTGPNTTDPATTGPALDMGAPEPITCPSDQALVACYLFEDGWQQEALVDGGPAAIDGAMKAATPVDGVHGKAAGTSETTTISVTSPLLARTAEWSVSAWVRLDALPAGARSGVLDRDGDYGIFVLASGIVHCGGATQADSLSTLSLGTWTHVTCVWREKLGLQVYIDGVLEVEAPWTQLSPPLNSPLVIANDSPPAPDEAWHGAIDEIMLWHRALTESDVCAVAGVGC